MIFKRKKKQPQPPEGSDHPSAETGMDQARDTVASLLRTLGKYALPTNQFPLNEFLDRTESLAKSVLIEAGLDGTAAKPARLQKVYAEIKQLIRQQRQVESVEYATYRESAHLIVADLVTTLKRSLEQREGYDQEIMGLLTEMEEVVERGDIESIKRAASKMGKQIKKVIALQRDRDREQLERLSDQLRTMREELNEAKSQMQRDPLTELLNRGAFDDAFDKTVSLCHASATDLTLFLLDLDHFKNVNDSWGHPAGDVVLRTVSKQLIRCFPRRDDLVARLGGEEFAVLCRNTGETEVAMLGERVRAEVERLEIDLESVVYHQTTSVGAAVLKKRESPSRFFKRADEALYQAKRAGRNRIELAP